MGMRARTNQGGSVASFLIVGGVLLAVVAGAVYFLQNRQENPSPSPTVTTSDKPQATKSASPSGSSEPTKSPTPSPRTSTPPAPTQKNGNPNADNMPATGPEDTLSGGFVVAALVGSMTAYIQSVRLKRRRFHL